MSSTDSSSIVRKPNEMILSFFDTVIYRQDLELLTGRRWINDVLIGFFYEYLEKNIYDSKRSDVAFVHPDVVFACASVDECSAAEMTKDINLPTKNIIFLPLNNNTDTESPGGTHWSLLVYHRQENVFLYLDSWHAHNVHVAKQAAARMELALGITERPKFSFVDTPQQENGFDCGIYVISFTELLCAKYLDGKNLTFECVTANYIAEKRQKLHDLILHLSNIF